jgi:hypothetical protein
VIHVSFTDQWQTLLDENGKPLIGRVKFFNADSTQYKSIFYDMQGETQGENPQYTLQDGRLEHQIFIGAGVYTCKVEKFVGTDVSSMRDHANDDTYWFPYKEFKIYGGAEEVESSGDLDAGFCDTIAALRLVNPSEHGVVSVVGYYSKDDGIEPRTYVWEDCNDDSEDYGSTIVSSVTGFTNTGRWKLCETPILCATTFGVFPDRSSSITASELSDKATSLCNFANNVSICTSVHFEKGHYYFSAGTTLNFRKKVVSNGDDLTPLMFDMDGVQDLGEDDTLVGSVTIFFIKGLETNQDSELSSDADYITFGFGEGRIKTSWINYKIDKHITASTYLNGTNNVECLLNSNSGVNFLNDGRTFNNWKFIGTDNAIKFSIPEYTTFVKCSFVGACFGLVHTGCTFIDCGTIYQENFGLTNFRDDLIFNVDGSVKSKNTTFLLNRLAFTQTYNDGAAIDNSCVKAYGNNCYLISSELRTLKYLDNDFIVSGKINFKNSDVIFASRFESFSNAVDIHLNFPSKKINLEGNSYTYTRETDENSTSVTLIFTNGYLIYERTGTSSVSDVLVLDEVYLSLNSPIVHTALQAKNSTISGIENSTLTPITLFLENCNVLISSTKKLFLTNSKSKDTIFNGEVCCYPYEGIITDSFIGCTFDNPVKMYTADTAETSCNAIVNACIFNIDNNGTKKEAISTAIYNSGSWKRDSYNRYSFEGNSYRGDAFLRPLKVVDFVMKSTTDDSDPSTGGDNDSKGVLNYFTIYPLYNVFSATATKFTDYSYADDKLFHIGTLDYVLKAKPLDEKTFYYGKGQDGLITPTSDFVTGTQNAGVTSTKYAIYKVYADTTLLLEDIREKLDLITWLVEIKKV